VNRFFKVFSIFISILVLILLVKFFYFDTDLGFKTEVLGYTMFSAPMFIEVLIGTPVISLLVYAITKEILDKLESFVSQHTKVKNKLNN